MTRVRSRSYPSFSLEDALEKAETVFERERRNPVDREVVAQHLGYKGVNGASDQALSTMMQYCMFERVDKGEVKVSQYVVDIIHPESPAQKKIALMKCALSPPLFQTLFEKFSEGLPSDGSLRSYLMRENYSSRAISAIITAYTKTYALMEKEDALDLVVFDDQTEVESVIAPISDPFADGFDLESTHENKERVVIAPKAEELVLLGGTFVQSQGEHEWMRNKLGSSTSIRILATGDIGAKEIGKLIKLLEAQKMVLEDD